MTRDLDQVEFHIKSDKETQPLAHRSEGDEVKRERTAQHNTAYKNSSRKVRAAFDTGSQDVEVERRQASVRESRWG